MLRGMTETEGDELRRLRRENAELRAELVLADADQEMRSAEARYRAIAPE